MTKKNVKKAKKTTMRDMFKVVGKWAEDNNSMFIGSFVEFNSKDGGCSDGRDIAFGCKDVLKVMLEEMSNNLKKEKSKKKCVNW